jgi:hypothetical protein
VGFPNIKAVLAVAVLVLWAAVSPAFASETAPARIVGFEMTGDPEELDIPFAALPPIPMPYSYDAVRRAGRTLARFLAENGYPYSQITITILRNGPDVVLRFNIDPDEKVCFGPPMIIGVGKERAGMFLRDIRFTPGQPYNAAAVDEAVRRLNSRPYVQAAAAMEPVIIEDGPLCCDLQNIDAAAQNADGGEFCRDTSFIAVAPIAITERRGTEFEGAVGYESGRDGNEGRWSGRVSLSLINMARRGEVIDAFYSGTDAVQRLRGSAAVPWIFGLPLEAGAAGGLEIEDEGYGHVNGEIWGAVEVGESWKIGLAAKGSETIPPESVDRPYRFYGADIFLSLMRRQWERGLTVWEFDARTGSGVANREVSYARSNMEMSAGVHRPAFNDYALALRVSAGSLFTDEDYLPPAELYRIGGHGSLRGYSEEEFAFRTAAFAQIEALYYFSGHGSVFIFVDGGAGFSEPGTLTLASSQKMLGYGLGLRFPSGMGTISIEWARNIDDGGSLGRVHVGIRTSI